MKSGLRATKAGCLAAISLLLVAANAWAQSTDSIAAGLPATMLKTVPIQLEEINLAVEKFYRPNRSLQYGVGYIYRTWTNTGYVGEPQPEPVDGVSLRLGYRMFTGKRYSSPQGGYHGPLVTYRYMSFPVSYYRDWLNQMQSLKFRQQVGSLQYILGMQRVFRSGFVLDAFLGLGARLKYATRNDSGSEDKFVNEWYPFYGREVKTGPGWELIAAPSVSFNIAIGIAIE